MAAAASPDAEQCQLADILTLEEIPESGWASFSNAFDSRAPVPLAVQEHTPIAVNEIPTEVVAPPIPAQMTTFPSRGDLCAYDVETDNALKVANLDSPEQALVPNPVLSGNNTSDGPPFVDLLPLSPTASLLMPPYDRDIETSDVPEELGPSSSDILSTITGPGFDALPSLRNETPTAQACVPSSNWGKQLPSSQNSEQYVGAKLKGLFLHWLTEKGLDDPVYANALENFDVKQGFEILNDLVTRNRSQENTRLSTSPEKVQTTAQDPVLLATNAKANREIRKETEDISPLSADVPSFALTDTPPCINGQRLENKANSDHQSNVSAALPFLPSFASDLSIQSRPHRSLPEVNIADQDQSHTSLFETHPSIVNAAFQTNNNLCNGKQSSSAENILQDILQKNAVTDSRGQTDSPPVKRRRRLSESGEDGLNYQANDDVVQVMQMDSGTTDFAPFAPENQESASCDQQGRQISCDSSYEHQISKQKTQRFEPGAQREIAKYGTLQAYEYPNPHFLEMLDEKLEVKPEFLNRENRLVRNPINRVQGPIIGLDSEYDSLPSYVVHDVVSKDGCMYSLLHVYKPAICGECNKKFPLQALLDTHMEKHLEQPRRHYRKKIRVRKEYRCKVCNLQLANEANLRRHNTIIHEGKGKETCNFCGANFKSRHGLVLHMRDLHDITPESVLEKRGRKRPKRSYKKKSVVSQRWPAWIVWKCGNCSFFSDNKGNLTRHIDIMHLKIAEYPCTACTEVFKTKHNLQVHLMNHHMTAKSIKYCGYPGQ